MEAFVNPDSHAHVHVTWPTILRPLVLCLSAWFSGPAHAALPEDIRALTLQDQRGSSTSLGALDGRTFVLNFIFTHCIELCHLQVRSLAAVRESLPAETRARVRFVSISIDPEHDTPQTLRRYAEAHHIAGTDWLFATASPEVVGQLTRLLDVKRQVLANGQIDHSMAVFLFDARGRLMQRYAGAIDTARLTREIQDVVGLFDSNEARQ